MHIKRPDDAFSARKMSKSSTPIPQPDSGKPIPKVFGVDVNVCTADGKLVYGPDGELLKQRVQMSPGTFADDRPQPLYYPLDCSVNPGRFKGMAEILKERGYQVCRQTTSGVSRLQLPTSGFGRKRWTEEVLLSAASLRGRRLRKCRIQSGNTMQSERRRYLFSAEIPLRVEPYRAVLGPRERRTPDRRWYNTECLQAFHSSWTRWGKIVVDVGTV